MSTKVSVIPLIAIICGALNELDLKQQQARIQSLQDEICQLQAQLGYDIPFYRNLIIITLCIERTRMPTRL